MTTGLLTAEVCLEHDTGRGHPERPARLTAVLDRLEADGLTAELDRRAAPAATDADLALAHPASYVERVDATIASGSGYVDSSDVNVSARSMDAARAAAGGALFATRQVLDGSWNSAFVCTRPPGHHAEETFAMGFCLFNNAVLAAKAAQDRGIERVAILDWDVHHGNGTQHLTERDPSILYASLHQHPWYPGSGLASEVGQGEGEGTVVNCPQAAGSGDLEWRRDFDERVLPAVESFRPGLVILSAGFDAHTLDPLSDTSVSTGAYGDMTQGVLEVCERVGAKGVVSLLEGGYSLEGLADSAAAHVAALLA